MNQDAGLKLSVNTYDRRPDSTNLEDVAAGDIIVVKEIALGNRSQYTPFNSTKGRVGRHVSKDKICFELPKNFLPSNLCTDSGSIIRKVRTLVRVC